MKRVARTRDEDGGRDRGERKRVRMRRERGSFVLVPDLVGSYCTACAGEPGAVVQKGTVRNKVVSNVNGRDGRRARPPWASEAFRRMNCGRSGYGAGGRARNGATEKVQVVTE